MLLMATVKPRPSAWDYKCSTCGHESMETYQPEECQSKDCLFADEHPWQMDDSARWGHEWRSVVWMATICDRSGMSPDFINRVIEAHGMSPDEEAAAWREWAADVMGGGR